MSPWKRFWLAWFGGWSIPLVAAAQICGTMALAVAAWWMQKPEDLSLFRIGTASNLIFVFLPYALGRRLQSLLSAESFAVHSNHKSTHARTFIYIILPALIGTIAAPCLLTGTPIIHALAGSISLAVLPIISTLKPRSTLAVSALFAFVFSRDFMPIGYHDSLLFGLHILFAFSNFIALIHIIMQPWPSLISSHSLTERFWQWMNTLWPHKPVVHQTAANLPNLGHQIRISAWNPDLRLWMYVGIPMSALVGLIITRGPDGIYSQSASVFLVLIAGCMPAWFLFISCAQSPRLNAQASIQHALAADRLRPWSRRTSAAASVLALSLFALGPTLMVTTGLIAGLIVGNTQSSISETATSTLWSLPFAALASVSAAASLIVMQTVPRVLSGLVFCLAVVVPLVGLTEWAPLLAAYTFVILPLAWYRLSICELP